MKIKATICSLLLLAGLSSGQDYYTQHLGPFDYTYGSNGYSGFGQQIGPFYYYHDNQGTTGYGQHLGSFDYYHEYNNGSAGGNYDYTPRYRYDEGEDDE